MSTGSMARLHAVTHGGQETNKIGASRKQASPDPNSLLHLRGAKLFAVVGRPMAIPTALIEWSVLLAH
ncbi:hypothetical protein D3C86_1957980 [compost metagenome]